MDNHPNHACVSSSVMSDSATLWTVARQAPLSMEFSRQEYWSGWPFPSPGNLPDPGIEPGSSALQADFFLLSEPPGKHCPTAPTMQNKKFKVWKNKTKQCVYISKSSPLGNPNASLLLAMGHVTLPLITYSTEGLGKRPEAGNGCIIIGVQLCSRLLVQY